MAPARIQEEKATGYGRLSLYRSELMGAAMLWVMLFHAYPFRFGLPPLDAVKQAGFAGVDIFLLLSALGLYVSLERSGSGTKLAAFYRRRAVRVLPAYWLVVGLYSLWLISQGRIGVKTALWSLSTLHYWFHIPDTFNWYVPALLAFYLLAPFYVRLFDRCPRKEWLTAAMFPLAYGIYRLTIPLHLNYTEDFVNRLPAFALGILAGHYLLTARRVTACHALVWGLLAAAGAKVVLGLDDLLTSPVDGSGYNLQYGLLGSNKADDDRVKLFPRDAKPVAEAIGKAMSEATGKRVEAMVYGDGAFKDPAGKIWELADPVVSPGFTEGLRGLPNELKLKYLADNDFAGLSGEELKSAIQASIRKKDADLKGQMASEGTTPRRLTDLIGSLCDLTSGSGDKGTPIIVVQNYFKNYAE